MFRCFGGATEADEEDSQLISVDAAVPAQFSQFLVSEFKKTAANRFRELAMVDATSCTKLYCWTSV